MKGATGSVKFQTRIIRGKKRYIARYTGPDGTWIGKMSWDDDPDNASIHVKPAHRRKGIATELWKAATEYAKANNLPAPQQARPGYQTPDGKAWAAAQPKEK